MKFVFGSKVLLMTLLMTNSLILGCDKSAGSTSSSYSYNHEENGCSTGEHSFASLQDYCDGLRNESLNHGCAFDLRMADFNAQCGGQAATPPSPSVPTPPRHSLSVSSNSANATAEDLYKVCAEFYSLDDQVAREWLVFAMISTRRRTKKIA